MSTTIRSEISKKNKYFIDKHRYYELKHFCLQYKYWKKMYNDLIDIKSSSIINIGSKNNNFIDTTSDNAIKRSYYSYRINLIEKVAFNTDKELYFYILKSVTEGLSYNYLKTKLDIPCCRDVFYKRYRKFFWLLNKERN